MRPIIISILLLVNIIASAQITFEEITALDDFSVSVVKKSPTGEYFIQLSNDKKSIYSSQDAIHWTKATLPENNAVYEMEFYSDGTPLIKNDDDDEQMIRRNGSWYTVAKSACALKNDTLFAYYDNTFSYSIDKGINFVTLFTSTEEIHNHTTELWKFKNHMVLHHTNGASDYLSVFTMGGQRVLFTELNSGIFQSFYNSCEQLLLVDYSEYYWLKEEGLEVYQGEADWLFPFGADADQMISSNGFYFVRDGNTIYKTNNCDFNWEIFAQYNDIETFSSYWVNESDDLVLWEGANNFFVEHKSGSGTWDEHQPDIQYPYVTAANEAGNKHQFATSPHYLFHKHVDETSWTKADTLDIFYAEVQYSPNGDLYINADSLILYSKDNGIHFENITIPKDVFGFPEFTMYVLGNNAILVLRDIGDSFYTSNNGESWINFPVSSFPYEQQYKLVGNYIYIINSEFLYQFTRRSTLTNEVEVVEFENLYNLSGYQIAIQDDGTIYFYGWDPTSALPEGIFRFRFGQELEPLPLLFPMAGKDLYASGSYLYTFANSTYQVYNGETLRSDIISGLPYSTNTKFMVAENEHLLAIINDNRIFRSKEPLSFPVGTNDIPDFLEFDLYPNPTHSSLHLVLPDQYIDQVNGYEIIDVMGRFLKLGQVNENTIDVSDLSPGIYNLVLVQNEIRMGQKKFAKI